MSKIIFILVGIHIIRLQLVYTVGNQLDQLMYYHGLTLPDFMYS